MSFVSQGVASTRPFGRTRFQGGELTPQGQPTTSEKLGAGGWPQRIKADRADYAAGSCATGRRVQPSPARRRENGMHAPQQALHPL
jgi:hypothetical protein